MLKMLHNISKYLEASKSTLALAIPITVSQIGHVLFGVVDSLMVGHVGAVPLAAAAYVNNLMSVPLVFLMGFGSAMSVFVARSYGEKRYSEAGAWLLSGLIASLLLLVIVIMLLCGLYPLLGSFGQPPDVVETSKSYYVVMGISFLPLIIFNTFRQFSEGLSQPRAALGLAYVGLLINIICNWFLIYGNWGFPQLGLFGAGVGTLIARIFMALALGLYVFRARVFAEFHFKDLKQLEWRRRLAQIRRVGLPSGFQYVFEVAAFSGSGILMGWLGEKALAAHQIALSLASITFMMSLGISIAASIRVGHAVGEKDLQKAKHIGLGALGMVLIFMTLTAFMFVLCRHIFPKFYIEDSQVLSLASEFLLIAAFFQLFDGSQAVAVGILRGLGDVKLPTITTFVAYWCFALPLGYYLGFYTSLGAIGIWLGLAAGLAISSITLSFRFWWLTNTV